MRSILRLGVVFFFLSTCLLAQEPGDPRGLLDHAYQILYDDGNVADAKKIFRQVANDYPGTEFSLEALRKLGNYSGTVEKCKESYQEIVDTFPGTVHETEGKLGIIGLTQSFQPDTAVHTQACSELAVQLGGPSYEEIVDSIDLEQATERIRSLNSVEQTSLLAVYTSMWAQFAKDYRLGIPRDPQDREISLKITTYLRTTFEPIFPDYDGMYDIRYCLGPKDSPSDLVESFVDPTVSFLAPAPGSQTGPQPKIQAQIVGGDISTAQVSLRNMVATLDGNVVTQALKLESSYADIQDDVPFETLSVEFTPSSSLPAGEHEFVLEVPVEKYPGQGPGKTLAVLRFVVQANGPGEAEVVYVVDVLSRVRTFSENFTISETGPVSNLSTKD